MRKWSHAIFIFKDFAPLCISLMLSLTFVSFTACTTTGGISNANYVAEIPEFYQSAEEAKQASDNVIKWCDEEVKKLIALSDKSKPENKVNLTFENIVKKVDDILYENAKVAYKVYLLSKVSKDKALRDQANALVVELSNWETSFYSHREIYQLVADFVAAGSPGVSNAEDKRLVQETLVSFKRMGHHLPPAEQAKIKTLFEELEAQNQLFQQNLIAANAAVMTFSPHDVAGIPEAYLADLKRDEAGNYLVHGGVSYEIEAILANSPREDIRKKVYIFSQSRAKESNKPVIKKILSIKAQIAHKLGYKHWADYVTEVKMVKNADTAMTFVLDLSQKLRPKLAKEIEFLRQMKAKETGDEKAVLHIYDRGYFKKKMEKEFYALDQDALKKYFQLDSVLNGMYRVYENLFGIKIEYVDAPYKWDEKVRLLKVSNADTYKDRPGETLGYLYLDLYPRPADGKYGHFAKFSVQSAKMIDDKTFIRPVAAIVGNFPEPKEGRPSLLKFDQVETVFHEFGHALHDMMTTARYYQFAGTLVPRDVVEAPSQMLEYWIHDKSILDTFAANYQDLSDKIPADTIKKIDEATVAVEGMMKSRQMCYAYMDLKMYTEIDENSQVDIVDFTNKACAEMYMPIPDGDTTITGFSHLFSGYDAGYYGYAWADVLAADMASLFEDPKIAPKGFFDQKLGLKLRKEIYERGSSRDVAESVRAFLGREPSNKAYLKHLGL